MRVRDIMSTPAIVVTPETPLRDVAALLSERNISGAPVVAHGEVVGVVSESDIVDTERGDDVEAAGAISHVRHRESAPAAGPTTAGEAMTSPTIVVESWMSPYEAAWLMSVHDVGRLPVVDRNRLVGIIARADLVRYFARPDHEIVRDLREEVIQPLDILDVSVQSTEGRVLLGGEVDSEADLRCLRHAVSRVPGVVAIDCQVRLRKPDATEASVRQVTPKRLGRERS